MNSLFLSEADATCVLPIFPVPPSCWHLHFYLNFPFAARASFAVHSPGPWEQLAPTINWSWCINTPAPLPLRWDNP